jgi:hypothetical protein
VNVYTKLLHLIPVIPVYLIIFTVIFAFSKNYTLDGKTTMLDYFVVLLFYINAIMVVICHTLAMWTNPGEVTIQPIGEIESVPNPITQNDPLFCKKCNGTRPERSHHCKVCKKCIIKMDHHCPWIANCVGHCNIKYFYLFLFYATFGDFIASICLYSKFLEIDMTEKLKNHKVSTIFELIVAFKDPFILFVGILCAVAMTVSIGFLFIIQTRNLTNDVTTLENLFELKKKSGNNPKERFENFKAIMGDKFLIWFVPVRQELNSSGSNQNPRNDLKSENINVNNYISLTDNVPEFEDNIHINLNLSD